MTGKWIDDLTDHTVQGIWEAQQAGELAGDDDLERTIIRSAGVLADRGCWMWLFTSATERASLWQDLHGGYWIVDPEGGEIREWGT